MSRYAGAVLEQLSRVFNQGTVVGLTEGKLLERFVAVGDEAAFAALVARHGLCYLEGLTHEEAAEQLRWPVGTVRSRMARARDLLRRRLVRRGFTTDGPALSTALARQVVPVTLIDSTIRGSFGFATKQATATSLASATATALATGVLHTMMISKFKVLGAATLAGVLAVGGARTLGRQFGAPTPGMGPAPADSKPNDRQTVLLRSVDKIDGLLDDLERRNRDVQSELRALREEILAPRSLLLMPTDCGSDMAATSTSSRTGHTSGLISTRTPSLMPHLSMQPKAPRSKYLAL